MNNLSTYISDRWGSIRTLYDGEKLLFCGKDIAKALGYHHTFCAVRDHCDYTVKHSIQTAGGVQTLVFIDVDDVRHLIVRSKLPDAKNFEQWFFKVFFTLLDDDGEPSTTNGAEYRLNPALVEKKTKRVQLVLQPSLYEKTKDKAHKMHLSLNEFVHALLESATGGTE